MCFPKSGGEFQVETKAEVRPLPLKKKNRERGANRVP